MILGIAWYIWILIIASVFLIVWVKVKGWIGYCKKRKEAEKQANLEKK
jgi:hypothetical protein